MDGICPHIIKKLSESQDTYSSLLSFFKFYFQYPFMAETWTVCLCVDTLSGGPSQNRPPVRELMKQEPSSDLPCHR